jgi:hypothetical protein
MDKQVFLIGSGTANDPAGVEAVCQEFVTHGFMFSAVAVAPDEAGADLLMGCTSVTGGFYGEGSSGIDALTDEAFKYMLHVDIDAEPEHVELVRNIDHTVTAVVFRALDPETYPVEDIIVNFEVISGPNVSETGVDTTDADGLAHFVFNGDTGPGTDMVLASALHPGTETAMLDTVSVTWLNTPPECDAGGPYNTTFDIDTAMVTLDATGSSDADGDTLMFHWIAYCRGIMFDDMTSATPVLTITGDCLCEDSIMVEVMVSDGYDSTTCSSAVYLDDQRPPVVVVKENPVVLWPPNHKHHRITPDMLLESAEDACGNPIDLSSAVIVSVTSDEPEDHKGDGKTMNDIKIRCPNHLGLRAERMGGGNGRVYKVTYRITAENGVSTDAEAWVIVPHDHSDLTAIEDEGAGYEVVPECGN